METEYLELVVRAANDPAACSVALWLNDPKRYFSQYHHLYRQIKTNIENKIGFRYILKTYHVESTKLVLPHNISFNELKIIAKHYNNEIMINDEASLLNKCFVGLYYDRSLGGVDLYVKSSCSWCCLL
jgi:hypothetical protein